MIGKKKTNGENPMQGINLINEGTRIQGDLLSNGDVRIDGHLKGEVNTAGRLAVGISGEVEGLVHAAYVDVAGKVTGNMVVLEVLTLRSTAQITGDVKVAKLIVEEGASFSGNCIMSVKQAGSLEKFVAENAEIL
jgi:cytoskeletal protein CcmA (bactofilin family)